MIDLLIRYLHFFAIIVFVGTLVSEHMLMTGHVTKQQINKIVRIDRVYGISALVVLAAGLSLWLWVGKPREFYAGNWILHMKVSLFFIMAFLSIHPSLYINKCHRSSEDSFVIPKSVINAIRAQLLCLVVIPLLAVLMANGYGH